MTDSGVGGRRRGAKLYMAGVGVAQVCALARYTVLTRLLGPEQLGLAVTLILTAQFFDSITESGSDRFLIQDEDGDRPSSQALVQMLAIGRGIAIALALLVFAGPIAGFYNEPGLAPGLMWLGLVPLVAGLLHFDVRRAQRRNDFRGEAQTMMASDVVSVAATAIAAVMTHSYVAALIGLLVRSAMLVLVSHLVAERPYRIGYAAGPVARLRVFALPLMANGLVLFLTSQGDRLLVGNQLGVVELGRYSAVLLLIYFPSMALMRYFHAMRLPTIVAARADRATLAARIDAMTGEAVLLSLAMVAGFAMVAPVVAPLLFGPRFAQPATIIALMGVLQVWRFVRIASTTAALAVGNSRVVLLGNVIRLLIFPAGLVGLWSVGGLLGLTLGLAIGEIVGVGITQLITNRAIGMPAWLDMGRLGGLAVACVVIVGTARAVERAPFALAAAASTATVAIIAGIVWRERLTVQRLWAMVPHAAIAARRKRA